MLSHKKVRAKVETGSGECVQAYSTGTCPILHDAPLIDLHHTS